MDKVRGGTYRDDQPALCRSCRCGTVMVSGSNNKEFVYCHDVGEYLQIKVTECSKYDDKAKPSYYQLEQAAWVLYTKKTGKEIGFMRSRDYRKEFGDILPDEPPIP